MATANLVLSPQHAKATTNASVQIEWEVLGSPKRVLALRIRTRCRMQSFASSLMYLGKYADQARRALQKCMLDAEHPRPLTFANNLALRHRPICLGRAGATGRACIAPAHVPTRITRRAGSHTQLGELAGELLRQAANRCSCTDRGWHSVIDRCPLARALSCSDSSPSPSTTASARACCRSTRTPAGMPWRWTTGRSYR